MSGSGPTLIHSDTVNNKRVRGGHGTVGTLFYTHTIVVVTVTVVLSGVVYKTHVRVTFVVMLM